MDIKDFKEALLVAIQQIGSQALLSRKTGVPSSTINLFYSGKRNIKNMTLSTFLKLFPETKVEFFKKANEPDILEIKDQLTSIMAKDWETLDEAEKAETVASIKRIIKQRPLASAGGGEQSEDQLYGVADSQTAYVAKKKKDGNS